MSTHDQYTPTEAQYKGAAEENYITYDLEQQTRGQTAAMYPKVKRVYLSGDVQNWEVGTFEKRSGRSVYGVRIDYERRREGYRRRGYRAERNGTTYQVPPTTVEASSAKFSKVIEIPEDAENIAFRGTTLPQDYQSALQDVK